jgi:hypothetical protein
MKSKLTYYCDIHLWKNISNSLNLDLYSKPLIVEQFSIDGPIMESYINNYDKYI